jgi:PAS domain S-box-containing protein
MAPEDGRDPAQAQLRAIFDSSLDGLITIDGRGAIVEFNRAAEIVFGYRREDVLGRDMAEVIVPPSLRDRHRRGMERYLATGEGPILGRRIEITGMRADGSEFPVELTVTRVPAMDHDGGRVLFTGALRDLTERKRVESRRAAQYAVTRILSTSPSLELAAPKVLEAICGGLGWELGQLWLLTERGDALACRASWSAGRGDTREFEAQSRRVRFDPGVGLPGTVWENARGAWLEEVTDSSNFPRAVAARLGGIRTGFGCPVVSGGRFLGVIEFFSMDRRTDDPDLVDLVDAVGRQLGDFIHRLDADRERSRAEEGDRFLVEAARLLASSLDDEATLRRLAELAVPRFGDWCAVDLVAPDGRLELLAAAHVDASKVELVRRIRERHPFHIDDPGGSPAVIRAGQPLLLAEIPEAFLEASAKDQEHLAMVRSIGLTSWICAPLAARGRVLGAISFATAESGRKFDRTDLLLAERLASLAAIAIDNARLYREAQKAVKLRDDFLAVAGHELRTPLSRLTLQIELMQRQGGAEESESPWAAKAQRSVERLASLIDELLDVSRISEGRLPLEPEELDLAELAREVTARFTDERRASAPIRVHADGPVVGRWDRRRLDHVIENLVSNALKYGDGKPVEVEVAEVEAAGGRQARLVVVDSGVGVSPRDQARIFERFERAVSGRAVGGLGLGLWIVREVVAASGGSVALESEPGKGSRFTVLLPMPER